MFLNENTQLEAALELALEIHKGQVDKGGTSYILHPVTLAIRILEQASRSQEYTYRETMELATVALLHDVVEDSNGRVSFADLYARGFRDTVVEAVVALTKSKDESYWKYIEKVKANGYARIVKLFDIEHNMDLRRLRFGKETSVALGQRNLDVQSLYYQAYLMLKGDTLNALSTD